MKKIMTLFVVCMMCLSLVGCAPAVMGYPMAGQIQNSWPYLTIQSSKMSQKTSTPKLESNSALVTVDGETELFYLANAEFYTFYYMLDKGNGRKVKVYHDYFHVCFYSYDSEGRVDKSLSFRLHTVGGRAEKGKIQTQDDFTKTGEGRNGDVSFTFSTATGVWSETDSCLVENQNDYTIEIVEVIEPEKTYRIRGTFKPHAASTVGSNNNNEKTKDVEFEALFTIGEVHSVVNSHGDSGNLSSAYKIRSDEGSNGSSGGSSSESSGESKGSNPYDTKHVWLRWLWTSHFCSNIRLS